MKKISTLMLGLALSGTLAAQTPQFTPEHGALLDGKTIVKANITSPALKTYSFSAERILSKGLSFQLGISTMPKSSLPLISTLEKAVGGETNLGALRLKSFDFTPEVRWYTGGGYGHGFYLMAYYRYQSYNLSGYTFNLDVRDNGSATTKPVGVVLSGDFKTNSFGIGLGAQWLFGRNKNIVLDWNILGLHAGRGKMTLSGDYSSATALTDKELEDLRYELSDNISDIPAVKLGAEDINLDKAGKKVSLNSVSTPWAWIRASVSLGFRF